MLFSDFLNWIWLHSTFLKSLFSLYFYPFLFSTLIRMFPQILSCLFFASLRLVFFHVSILVWKTFPTTLHVHDFNSSLNISDPQIIILDLSTSPPWTDIGVSKWCHINLLEANLIFMCLLCMLRTPFWVKSLNRNLEISSHL